MANSLYFDVMYYPLSKSSRISSYHELRRVKVNLHDYENGGWVTWLKTFTSSRPLVSTENEHW